MIPKFVFFTKGIGTSKTKLQSFEAALRDAGISHVNLVKVSSILPPDCQELARNEGLQRLHPGQITFAVLAKHTSNEPSRKLATSIGVAKPKDSTLYGYLSEHHCLDQDTVTAGDFAEDLAASMLASALGIDFDLDADYDEKREIFLLSDKIVETKSITSSAIVDTEGEFTTVVAAAVFLLE
jgi:arginine decarboxylase